MRLAFIDIETTGGRSTQDRITEVAIKILENDKVVESWQSLVNPKTSIPPFIQSLTGINNPMVADAPLFSEIADTIAKLTENSVFVAHNARFDYGFIKAEFKRLNIPFNRRVMCTVKLSRALYPEHKGHGLDKLIQRHSIIVEARHRAMADVDATIAFFTIAKQEITKDTFEAAIQKQFRKPSLPKGLTEAQINEVPDSPGVYRFYGENNALLYVGKSVNMYQRVMSHFSSDHSSTKGMTISQSITHIDWTETTGDLGAQLLELKQIKTLNPIYNRRSRAAKNLVMIKLEQNPQGYLTSKLARELDTDHLDQFYGLYRSKNAAEKALLDIASKNDLCRKLLGLDNTSGPCFGYQTGSCKGACMGDEDNTLYNLRMQIAFHELQLKVWPFKGIVGVKEQHPKKDWEQIHLIYNWCHLGTAEANESFHDIIDNASLKALNFDLDTYKLLSKAILSPELQMPIIELNIHLVL